MQNFKVWNEQIVGEKGDWKPQKNRWPVLRMPPLQAYEKPDATSAGRLSAEVLKRWRAKKTSWASALLGRKKRHRTSGEGAVSEGQPAMEGGSMYCNCLTFPWILMDCNLLAVFFIFLPFDLIIALKQFCLQIRFKDYATYVFRNGN